MERAYEWLYGRLGRRYLAAIAVIEVVSALLIALGTLGILRLYVHMSEAQFLRILGVTEALVLLGLAYGGRWVRTSSVPLRRWVAGKREGLDPSEVWCSAVSLPLGLVQHREKETILIVVLPASVFGTAELGLPFYSVFLLLVGGLVAIAYAAVLGFFAAETALRPVVREVAPLLPDGFSASGVGVPLRWKLLGSLPLINVITGVVVSGLSNGQRGSLEGLGLSVVVAVLVAFTISLELTVLVSRSILRPVRDLLNATSRVTAGDYSVRVPVSSGDELGTLALSFNEMTRGLREREALQEAFASYVDPQVAQRVLEEGTQIEGEEVDVTVAFIDIRNFTSFAERASARDAVAYVNEFLGLTVPIITRYGGHANKFIGDGLLAVFGAPVRLADHADRTLGAVAEIASRVDSTSRDGRLRIGVGVSSGPVLAGTVGGGGKLDFTVIGDAVNVASRVEEATRTTGDTVLVTEATRALLSRDWTLEPRGSVSLKGRSDPVHIHALVDFERQIRHTAWGAASGVGSGR